MTDRKPSLIENLRERGLLGAGVLGGLWAVLPALGGFLLLARIGPVSEYLQASPYGVLIYILAFGLTSGLGLLPTYAQAVLGGWVFGHSTGLLAALGGFTLGALIGYVFCRSTLHDQVKKAIDEHQTARRIRRALVERGPGRNLLVITLLRIPPNMPFALSNLVMATSGVRAATFILGTILGMTPRTAVAVFFAAAAASTGATDIQEFVKDGRGLVVFVVGLLVMLVILAIIGRLAQRALDRVTE